MKEIKPADAQGIAGGSTGREMEDHLYSESTEAKSPVEVDYTPLPHPDTQI